MAQSHTNSAAARFSHKACAAPLGGFWTILGLLAVLVVGSPAAAEGGGDVYTVADVEVDATADTATAARDRALAEGQKAALGRLFDRIVLEGDRKKLPQVSDGGIAQLVRDFEVAREKRSSVRYLAVLRVRFKADGIRELLRAHDVGFAETRSKPVLVLPVFEVAGAFSLWGEPNPWRDAWLATPRLDGLVPLIRPSADIRNSVMIGAEQAVRGDDERLAAIARHNGAVDVLVAVAGFRMGSAGDEGQVAQLFLQVTLNRMGTALAEQTRLESFALRAGESRSTAIGRAVRVIAAQIQEEWKRDNRLRFGVGGNLTVTVPFTSLAEWLYFKHGLARVPSIQRSDLLYFSRAQARLRIEFIGDEAQLALALIQNDIILERGAVSWTLRRARKGRAAVKLGVKSGVESGVESDKATVGGAKVGGEGQGRQKTGPETSPETSGRQNLAPVPHLSGTP